MSNEFPRIGYNQGVKSFKFERAAVVLNFKSIPSFLAHCVCVCLFVIQGGQKMTIANLIEVAY